MLRHQLLVLTDHSTHTEENSIYPLLREMSKDPQCSGIDVVSRGNDINQLFFEKMAVKSLYATKVHSNFSFTPDGRFLKKDLHKVGLRSYDAVLLRLPHPIAPGFLQHLASSYPNTLFINAPQGIELTGSKTYLLNFPELCPPLKHCKTIADIEEFRKLFSIVLKPVRNYGGRGVIKIEDEKAYRAEGGEMPLEIFFKSLEGQKIDFIAARYLKNVSLGDKRIIVCNGQILGAALRLPANNGWVCNVARGGKSSGAEADEDEMAIIGRLNPALAALGIIFYGIDTLVNDDGRRVLSEINTLSIGGLSKIAEYSRRPVVRQAADILWDYIDSKLKE